MAYSFSFGHGVALLCRFLQNKQGKDPHSSLSILSSSDLMLGLSAEWARAFTTWLQNINSPGHLDVVEMMFVPL